MLESKNKEAYTYRIPHLIKNKKIYKAKKYNFNTIKNLAKISFIMNYIWLIIMKFS